MAIQWLLMAFKGLLMVIQGLLRAIQCLYSWPSGATPSLCGSSLVAAPPCVEASGSCLRLGTRGHVTAAPGMGQPERPVGSRGVSVEKAALSRGCGAGLGAAPAAGREQGAPPRSAKSQEQPEQAWGALAPQRQDGARWELILLPLALRSAPSISMDFSRPCAQAARAQHSSCQRPQHRILHPNSVIWPECGIRFLGTGVSCMGWGSLSARLWCLLCDLAPPVPPPRPNIFIPDRC